MCSGALSLWWSVCCLLVNCKYELRLTITAQLFMHATLHKIMANAFGICMLSGQQPLAGSNMSTIQKLPALLG